MHYERLLVPLDGSARAGSALPLATAIAKTNNAQLLLTHVVTKPEMARLMPLTPEENELITRFVERNQEEGNNGDANGDENGNGDNGEGGNSNGGDKSGQNLEPEQFRRYRAYARIAKRYEQDPRTKPYLDSFVSLDQEVQAHDVVQQLRARWQAIPKVKQVLPIEEDVRTVSRQSLVTTRALPAGHTITRADLTIKRPGTGIAPFELDNVLGARLTEPIEADTPLTQNVLRK